MKEYSYNIINDVYNWMVSRKKDIEVRILKEKSEVIKVGDIITFNNQDNIGKYVKVKITNKTIVNNVYELTEKFDIERIMPGHTKKEFIELMQKIYKEELNKKQIVAFEFEFLYCDSDIKIIEYNEKYLEDVKDLLVELEEYIISIDKDNLDQLHPEYREIWFRHRLCGQNRQFLPRQRHKGSTGCCSGPFPLFSHILYPSPHFLSDC